MGPWIPMLMSEQREGETNSIFGPHSHVCFSNWLHPCHFFNSTFTKPPLTSHHIPLENSEQHGKQLGITERAAGWHQSCMRLSIHMENGRSSRKYGPWGAERWIWKIVEKVAQGPMQVLKFVVDFLILTWYWFLEGCCIAFDDRYC